MKFDFIKFGSALKIVSTVATGLYAGGVYYVSAVECPGRATHDPKTAVRIWKPTYILGKDTNGAMALISIGSSFVTYICLRNHTPDAINWLGAGMIMATLFPFTLVCIMPLNNQLLDTEKCIKEKGDKWICENLRKWQKVHTVRTVLSLGAFTFMVYTIWKS